MKVTHISGFDHFNNLLKSHEDNSSVDDIGTLSLVLLFMASDDPDKLPIRESWCPDCRLAQPVINQMIEDYKYNDQIHLAVIQVGSRDEWKNPNNQFRKHKLQITAVPTLLSLKNNTRLIERECLDTAQVAHLFSNSI